MIGIPTTKHIKMMLYGERVLIKAILTHVLRDGAYQQTGHGVISQRQRCRHRVLTILHMPEECIIK